MVTAADVVIAEVTYPSLGVGIELGIAAECGIPILLAACDARAERATPKTYVNPDSSTHTLQLGGGIITLMAQGLPTVGAVLHYPTFDSLPQVTADALQRLAEEMP